MNDNEMPVYQSDYSQAPQDLGYEPVEEITKHRDLIKYAIRGYFLYMYKSHGILGNSKAARLLSDVKANIVLLKAQPKSEPLQKKDMKLRQQYLESVIASLDVKHYETDRSDYFEELHYRILKAIVASAVDLPEGSSWVDLDCCPAFLHYAIKLAGQTSLDLREYFRVCFDASAKVFEALVAMFRRSKQRLTIDPLYRTALRISLEHAMDSVMDSMGERYWKALFPASEQTLDSPKTYNLTSPTMYDLNCGARPNRLVVPAPFNAIQLEAHHIVALPIIYAAVMAKFKDTLSIGDLIAMGYAHSNYNARLLYRKMAPDNADAQKELSCFVEVTRSAVCKMACNGMTEIPTVTLAVLFADGTVRTFSNQDIL